MVRTPHFQGDLVFGWGIKIPHVVWNVPHKIPYVAWSKKRKKSFFFFFFFFPSSGLKLGQTIATYQFSGTQHKKSSNSDGYKTSLLVVKTH